MWVIVPWVLLINLVFPQKSRQDSCRAVPRWAAHMLHPPLCFSSHLLPKSGSWGCGNSSGNSLQTVHHDQQMDGRKGRMLLLNLSSWRLKPSIKPRSGPTWVLRQCFDFNQLFNSLFPRCALPGCGRCMCGGVREV